MEGPCASDGEEDEETLQEYAARRLQLAELPTVEISAAELDSVSSCALARARVCLSLTMSVCFLGLRAERRHVPATRRLGGGPRASRGVGPRNLR